MLRAVLRTKQTARVAIARALVKSPSLVIADEPTGDLDSATAGQIVDLLRELAHEHGAAVIVATHDDGMSNYCDRVLRLTDGEMNRCSTLRPQSCLGGRPLS